MEKLKFEGRFKVGQKIRAYDFAPRESVGPCYLEGPILAIRGHGEVDCQFPHYLVVVKKDVFAGEELEGIASRIDGEFCVPFQVWRDWDERIVLAQEAA
jgi:hypothetical protein